MNITNFDKIDAFEEASQQGGNSVPVHVRIQARNRRKCILTVQGLDDDLDLKKICKFLRKHLKCNGAVVTDKTHGDIIQLQGDHRETVKKFLVDNEICTSEQVIIHGV